MTGLAAVVAMELMPIILETGKNENGLAVVYGSQHEEVANNQDV